MTDKQVLWKKCVFFNFPLDVYYKLNIDIIMSEACDYIIVINIDKQVKDRCMHTCIWLVLFECHVALMGGHCYIALSIEGSHRNGYII